MATLWIREYSRGGVGDIAPDRNLSSLETVGLPIPQYPQVVDQKVTYSTSVQSAAFNAATSFIRIISTAAFHYTIAANPTATTDMQYVPANHPVDVGVLPGQKIAAIAAA